MKGSYEAQSPADQTADPPPLDGSLELHFLHTEECQCQTVQSGQRLNILVFGLNCTDFNLCLIVYLKSFSGLEQTENTLFGAV